LNAKSILAGGIIGLAFLITLGYFSSAVEVESDPSNVDFVICDTSIGAGDHRIELWNIDTLGCVEYFLVHMICDHDSETNEYHGTYAYEPDTLTIPVGKTVVWRNDDIHGVSGVTNKGTNFNPGDQMNMSDKLDAVEQRNFGGTHDVTFDLANWNPNDVTFDLEHNGVLSRVQSPTIQKGDMGEIRNDFNLDVNVGVQGFGWSYTFLERGDFPYYCSIHPWMTGIVHVV